MNKFNNIDKALKIYWSGLAIVFISWFSLRLGIIDATYFFFVTATTVGYGEMLPLTVIEKVLCVVVGTSANLSFATIGAMIIVAFIRKKMDTLPENIQYLIVTSNHSKLSNMLKEFKLLNINDISVICDGEVKDYEKMLELKSKYKFTLVRQPNLLDENLLKNVKSIKVASIPSRENTSSTENSYRVNSIIKIFEQQFECRTIGEIKGDIEESLRFSDADHLVPVTNGILLTHEMVTEGTFKRAQKLVDELRLIGKVK